MTKYAVKHGGYILPHHLIDISLIVIVAAGATATIAPPDYRAIGVAAIGAVIGGLIAARVFRDRRRGDSPEWTWGISTLTSIAFSPAIFDYLSTPLMSPDGATVLASAVLPKSASMMLATATTIAICSWGLLKLLHKNIIGGAKAKLEKMGWISSDKDDGS